MEFLAHVKRDEDGEWLFHELEEHLPVVARRAAGFSTSFAPEAWAYLAGCWHDLGKYQPEFLKYIRSASGLDAHIETAPGKVKHAIAGAIHATEVHGAYGRLLAYLIAGHHAGLPDWHPGEAKGAALSQELESEAATLAKAKSGGAPAHSLFDRLTVKSETDVIPRDFSAYADSVLFDGKPVAVGETIPAAPGVTLLRKC